MKITFNPKLNCLYNQFSPLILVFLFVVLCMEKPAIAATTWDPVFVPATTSTGGSQAINASGLTATAVVDSTTGANTLTVSLHSSATGWTVPVAVSAIGENPAYPLVAVDAEGVVTVVYVDTAIATTPVKSVQYSGGTWSAPVVLPLPASDIETRTSGIGVTATGIVSVGISRVSTRTVVGGIVRKTYALEVFSLEPGGTWSSPSVVIDGIGGTSAPQASFAMNSSGQAVAKFGILASRSDAIGSWNPVASLTSNPITCFPRFGLRDFYGSATIDASGKAYVPIAMYGYCPGSSYYSPTSVKLWTSSTGTGWTGIEQPTLKGFYNFVVAGTSANNAVAVGVDTSLRIRAFRTSDGGQTWIAAKNLGNVASVYVGGVINVSGSETGTAAVAYMLPVSPATTTDTQAYVATMNSKNAWSTTLMKNGLAGDTYFGGNATVTGNFVAFLNTVATPINLSTYNYYTQAYTGKIQ